MKPIGFIVIAALLVIALVASVASFTMPSLLGRPIVPSLGQQSAPELPSQAITPGEVAAQDETFSLTLSGNVYLDKIPVEGAEVTIYLNGKKMGTTTAGDLYQFQVPGVRIGDVIRVDATYEGYTGTATEKVKFKSIYLDVNIKSGRSFIRNALEMLPTKDDISQAEQQPQTTAATTPTSSSGSPSSSTTSTSSADANALTSQIVGDTTKTLTNTIGQTNNAMTAQPVTTADTGSGLKISDLGSAMNAAGF
jgi:hypothetical protein